MTGWVGDTTGTAVIKIKKIQHDCLVSTFGRKKREKKRDHQCTPDGIVAGAIGGAAGSFSFGFLDGDAADIVFWKIKMQKKQEKESGTF